jgi:hypothetical protein
MAANLQPRCCAATASDNGEAALAGAALLRGERGIIITIETPRTGWLVRIRDQGPARSCALLEDGLRRALLKIAVA